jgi:hypothetical protein
MFCSPIPHVPWLSQNKHAAIKEDAITQVWNKILNIKQILTTWELHIQKIV